jgi:hypothetical protein
MKFKGRKKQQTKIKTKRETEKTELQNKKQKTIAHKQSKKKNYNTFSAFLGSRERDKSYIC